MENLFLFPGGEQFQPVYDRMAAVMPADRVLEAEVRKVEVALMISAATLYQSGDDQLVLAIDTGHFLTPDAIEGSRGFVTDLGLDLNTFNGDLQRGIDSGERFIYVNFAFQNPQGQDMEAIFGDLGQMLESRIQAYALRMGVDEYLELRAEAIE